MANGSFLREIGSGIFQRLEEHRQEQQRKDSENKLQTLNLLAGLADKIEPGSLPVLMQHMGSVMNLKGPMRKFWDAFGGTPDLGFETALGQKLGEITSGFVGPEEARQARKSSLDELLAPYRQTGTRPRSVEALQYANPPRALQGKMVFRDPIREKREETENLYGVQLANNLRLQDDKGKVDLLLERERAGALDKRQMVQTRLKFNEELAGQIKFYRAQGVDPKQARRLSLNDYSDLATQLGIPVPPLTLDDNKVLNKVQSQINRLNQLTLRGMGGGDRDNVQTWIELSDGAVVPANQVNFDRLPIGVTVKRMFTTMNGQPISFGGGGPEGQFTIDEAKRQLEVMRKAGRSTQQINSAIEEMIKDNPKMKSELEKLKKSSSPSGMSFEEFENKKKEVGLSGYQIGPPLSPEEEELLNPEATRRRIELEVMKSEVNWLKSQLDYAEKQLAISPGIVQRESLQKQVNDLKRRLNYAEGEFNKKAGTSGGRIVIPPPTEVKPGRTVIPTPTPKVAHPPTPVKR